MWKILENLVPNLIPKVQIYTSERRGRLCYTQHVPVGHIGSICFNSFRWKASRLFNALPANIILYYYYNIYIFFFQEEQW